MATAAQHLQHPLETVVLKEGTLSIGRARDNNVRIKDATVSSHHANIFTYMSASYIEDLGSTNGTYVTLQTGQVVFLRRESLPLWGSGQLALGAAAAEGVGHTVDYRCA